MNPEPVVQPPQGAAEVEALVPLREGRQPAATTPVVPPVGEEARPVRAPLEPFARSVREGSVWHVLP